MNYLKKLMLILTILLVLVSCSDKKKAADIVSAQQNQKEEAPVQEEKKWSENFAELMDAAKKLDEHGRYCSALNAYYMAMEIACDMDEAMYAYRAHYELAKVIESGKPGRGEYDTFSYYEAWKNLLIDAEEIGNKYFPYELYFGSFEKSNLNFENRTADYYVPISITSSLHYQQTIGIISKGYEKANKEGWNDLPEKFPSSPVTKDSLFTRNRSSSDYDKKYSSFDYRFPADGYYPVGLKNQSIIPYECVFQIIDTDEDKVYAESKPYIIGSREDVVDPNLLSNIFGAKGNGGIIKFVNVPEDGIKAIENGKAMIWIKSINLIYGDIESNLLYDGRKSLKGGMRKEIDPNRVICNVHYHGGRHFGYAKLCFTIQDVQLNKFETTWYIGNKKIHCIAFDNTKLKEFYNGGFPVLNREMMCVMCNELSRIYNRQPVYLSNGSSEPCNFINIINNFDIDNSANGFRIPTIDNLRKMLSSAPLWVHLPELKIEEGLFTTSYNYTLFENNGKFQYGTNLLFYYLE